ncbi:hypothetical protein Tco_1019315 [Tanacetum coccineum]|uniref:Uncharacterized protein n=1 Tax=Tanacetum coccineum TaxID=301880 RepID=A0ABQ5FWW6_9ASTR
MALPLRDQRHQYLRYKGLKYTNADILDFQSRLTRIYRREVHRVQVFDFGGLPDLMAEGLRGRMLMKHRYAQGVSLFTSRAWRRLFDIKGPLVHELILEFFSTFRFGEAILDLDTLEALQFQLGMDVGSVNVPYLLARYLRLFAVGRKIRALIYGGQFAVPAPVQAPPPPPTATRTMPQRMARLEEDVHEIRGALAEQREVIGAMARVSVIHSIGPLVGLSIY